MTPEEIEHLVTRGTTQYQRGKVKCLHIDLEHNFCLVKWPGEGRKSGVLSEWVSSWVERYPLDNLGIMTGKQVWNSERGVDGRLTPKRLKQLIAREI